MGGAVGWVGVSWTRLSDSVHLESHTEPASLAMGVETAAITSYATFVSFHLVEIPLTDLCCILLAVVAP